MKTHSSAPRALPPLKLWHPEWFQGSLKRKGYFEGWYFKQASAGGTSVWSLIPGISLSRHSRKAFIQAISGSDGATWFFEFPVSDFRAYRNPFRVEIGPNSFSSEGLRLECGDGPDAFRGELRFSGRVPFPSNLLRPGVMGPFSFMPSMECYHGVVSLDHRVDGELATPQGRVPFNGGRGYTEKDWGTSMPSSWIWMQTNHLGREGDSLMLSVARIPWLRGHFIGFLLVGILDGEFVLRTTYTGSRLEEVEMTEREARVVIRTGRERIEVSGKRERRGILLAPVSGSMDRRIAESVDARITLLRVDGDGKTLNDLAGCRAGMEIVGAASELAK